MSELNRKYFETKERHKESYKKGSMLLWIILALASILYVINIVLKQKEQNHNIEITP